MHDMFALIPMFIFMVMLLIPVAMILLIARMLLNRRDSRRLNREEEMQLAQLMDSLDRMEHRIQNLETILMQKERPTDSDIRR